ncbi:MAG: hypothetical protein BMS9Abin33_0709 [Gammaproteobacteria bacterium]|nr:MAG: hypothetical protein BMS9Abin33_0709 [Gammaproteobacteria bacterium]
MPGEKSSSSRSRIAELVKLAEALDFLIRKKLWAQTGRKIEIRVHKAA